MQLGLEIIITCLKHEFFVQFVSLVFAVRNAMPCFPSGGRVEAVKDIS